MNTTLTKVKLKKYGEILAWNLNAQVTTSAPLLAKQRQNQFDWQIKWATKKQEMNNKGMENAKIKSLFV